MQYLIENLFYFLGIIIVVVVGGSFMFIKTGMGYRIRDMMKPAGDKHISAKVFCEDNQIRDRNLLVGRYIITDEKKRRGFYLVHQLLLSEGWGLKRFLALTERGARPIDFNNRLTAVEWNTNLPTAQRVFIDTTADLESNAGRQISSNIMMISLSIIAMMVGLVVIIMAIIIFFGGSGSETAVVS